MYLIVTLTLQGELKLYYYESRRSLTSLHILDYFFHLISKLLRLIAFLFLVGFLLEKCSHLENKYNFFVNCLSIVYSL